MAKDVKIFDGTAWVSIVGPPGADGVDGVDGSGVDIKGTAVAYPPAATPDVGDMWIVPDPVPAGFPAGTVAGDGLVWTGTEWNNVGGVRGPKGADGADGADGAPGVDGAKGDDGIGFTYRGDYDPDAEYQLNDVIYWQPGGGTFVLAALDGKSKRTEPGASPYWVPMTVDGKDGAKGDAGADGVGFTFKGEWDSGTLYQPNDVVTFNGTTLVFVTGGGDEETTDASAWSVLASSGASGAKGDKGDTGADGAPGVDGSVTIRVDDPTVSPSTEGLLSIETDGNGTTNGTGPDGSDVYNGPAGADGKPGADGADGRSVAVTKSPTQPATAAIGDFWIEE